MLKLRHLLATVALGAGLAAALPAVSSQAAQAFLHARGNGGGHGPVGGRGPVGGHLPAGGNWVHTWHGGHYGWWYSGPGFWYAYPYSYYYGSPYGYPYPYPDPAYAYPPPDAYGPGPDNYGPPSGYGQQGYGSQGYGPQGDEDDQDADDQGPTQNWYYCDASKAYYPYVKDCQSGWREVAPQPPQGPATRPPANTQR